MPSDYDQIRLAVQYLNKHTGIQPSLPEMASAIGLSLDNCQRVLARWAGIDPNLLFQQLTLDHSNGENKESCLAMAESAEPSSSDRPYKFFVDLCAVSPNQYHYRGESLQISYGFHTTRFGRCLVGTSSLGVCWLSFVERDCDQAVKELCNEWPKAQFNLNPSATRTIADLLLPAPNQPQKQKLPLCVQGTDFQIRVWMALLHIPEGEFTTYGKIAKIIGKPSAARAVGNAVGANPIAYLIPCHRVIRETGGIGGYRWSPERKRILLAWERARSTSQNTKI
jgi:AraC family transcriptional regulator of adaptative response/methylated-DNA-[protein]-cysteine methyltransferase